jgi:protein-tyrosine phosphatase
VELDWPGTRNTRDLGGLATAAGGRTRPGALVRSASLQGLSADGWQALLAYGVRTVVDLRDDDEIGPDAAPRPAEITTVQVPLDGSHDREFWAEWRSGPQFGTPLYYGPHLERMPERSAAVVSAIANAKPGGVAFHCQGGRDRSGQIALLLLALAGVPPTEIAADYARSEGPDTPELDAFLAARDTTSGAVIEELLATVDVEASLRRGGLDDAALAALRDRFVEEDA